MNKKLLIVLDSLTRNNGAHVSTREMIAALKKHGVKIDLLLGHKTDDVAELEGVTQYELPEPTRGFRWFVQGVYRHLKLAPVPRWVLDPWGKARRLMRQYDTVLVIGENSHYRWLVAGVKGPRKVVFIHTDYVPWKTSCGWAIEDSRFDRQTYEKFDRIGVAGNPCAARFAEYYPAFKQKVCTFHNLFYANKIEVEKRGEGGQRNKLIQIVTLSRLEIGAPKQTDRLIRVAGELKRRGCRFDWMVYGKASSVADEEQLKSLVRKEGVEDCFHFAGYTREGSRVLAEADLEVLLSSFETGPNVIYESQTQGTPCISTDVGIASETIVNGKTGLVLPQDEPVIVAKMEDVLKHPEMIAAWRKNLVGYRYDNEKVLKEYGEILGFVVEKSGGGGDR